MTPPPTKAELAQLERDRAAVRQEWARRFLMPKDYSRVIVLLGVLIGVMLCGSLGGFIYTLATIRDNQRELLCTSANTQELIVAYVKARDQEARAKGLSPPPNPPSATILREFSKDAQGLRNRAGARCPFPAAARLAVERGQSAPSGQP